MTRRRRLAQIDSDSPRTPTFRRAQAVNAFLVAEIDGLKDLDSREIDGKRRLGVLLEDQLRIERFIAGHFEPHELRQILETIDRNELLARRILKRS